MKPFEQQTYYELLEIPVSSTPDEIRAAYTRALEVYSPDAVALYALVDENQLQALRNRLTEAMEFLTDPELRVEYDRSIGLSPTAVNTVVQPVPALAEKAPEAPAPAVEAKPEPRPEPVQAVEPTPPAVEAVAAKQETPAVETAAAPVVESVAAKQETPVVETAAAPVVEVVAVKQETPAVETAAAPVVEAVVAKQETPAVETAAPPVVEAAVAKQETPVAAEPSAAPVVETVAAKQEPARTEPSLEVAPVSPAAVEAPAPVGKGGSESPAVPERESPASEPRTGTEAPRSPYPSFAVSYVPRSVVEPGQLNSVAFFTSFTIPVQTQTLPPVAEVEPKKQERAEEPRAAEPAPSLEPVAAKPAEPEPAEPVAAKPAEPVRPVEPVPSPEPVATSPAPKPAEKPEATPEPVIDAAEFIADAADEVTPARIKAHKRSAAAERLAQARPVESSRSAGTPAPPKAVPPPLPPRGTRVARPTGPASSTPVPPQPAEPARPTPPRSEPAASGAPKPEPTPARPPTSQPAEVGLVPAPRPREQPRPKTLDIPSDAEFNGELLRRVRESRGYSIQQVAERTRISLRHLENVEADRYKDLPAHVYLRGILMNLARELGLDPLRVSRSYLTLASKGRS
jgi:hypothetical protein